MRLGGPALLAVLLAPALAPMTAQAHPVDEVVQNSYLTLRPNQIALQLDISPGVAVAGRVLRSLDANGDRRISDSESRAFGSLVLRSSSLTLDGKPAAWRLESVAAPALDNIRQGGDTIKIHAVADRAETAGPHSFDYLNRYNPAETQASANVFLQPGGGWRYAVTGQTRGPGGRGLTVRYAAGR